MGHSERVLCSLSAFLAALTVAAALGNATCPSSNPVQTCAFYFAANATAVPTFNVTKFGNDQPISSAVKVNVSARLPAGTTVDTVNVASTILTLAGSPAASNDAFYITGNPPTLRRRNFVPASLCVLLNFTSTALKLPNGTVFNLNPNDGSPIVPQAARCILFQTSK